jgi:hypothetical protein
MFEQLLEATVLHSAKSIHLPRILVLVKLDITCKGNTFNAFVAVFAYLIEDVELLVGLRIKFCTEMGILRHFNLSLMAGSNNSTLKSPKKKHCKLVERIGEKICKQSLKLLAGLQYITEN